MRTPFVEELGLAALAAGPFLLTQSVGTHNPTDSFFTVAFCPELGIVLDMRQSESTESLRVDPLLGEVLTAISAAGVSKTRFGYTVAGDPTLIPKMERGRHIKKPALRGAIEAEVSVLRRQVAAAALD